MYYTVTVNPAVDYYMTVPDFSVSDINRSQFETLSFGGKGINVSKMMKALGMESTALGFIAGFTGTALKNDLKKYGIPSDFVVLKDGFTRINVKIRGKSETDINAKGPEIPDFAVKSLIGKFKNLSLDDTVIVTVTNSQSFTDFELTLAPASSVEALTTVMELKRGEG